jgi:hypothetical protein
MSDLKQNAHSFLQKRFPQAMILSVPWTYPGENGDPDCVVDSLLAIDYQSGIKQRAIVTRDLGSLLHPGVIAGHMDEMFESMDKGLYYKIEPGKSMDSIDRNQMVFAARIILYTDELCAPAEEVKQAFGEVGALIEIAVESEMHKTLFVSYGGPNAQAAAKINQKIKAKGVKTWFFPVDALPGQKLHRMMHDGVNKYDRVLLICSKDSLTRPGVLNEIERVLEREAKEGGSSVLIPITLDDFVFSDWAPEREDLADQLRSRVITTVDVNDQNKFDEQIERIVTALQGT